jgi:hypothetical protein
VEAPLWLVSQLHPSATMCILKCPHPSPPLSAPPPPRRRCPPPPQPPPRLPPICLSNSGPPCGRFKFTREEFNHRGEGIASGRLCFLPPIAQDPGAFASGTRGDAPTLLVTDDGNGRVVELDVGPVLARGEPPLYLRSFGGSPHQVPIGITANSTHIAVASWSPRESSSATSAVTLYDAVTRDEVWTVSMERPVALAFSTDGATLAVAEFVPGKLKLLSVTSGTVLAVMGDYDEVYFPANDILGEVVGTPEGFLVVHRGIRHAQLIGAVDKGGVGAWQSSSMAKARWVMWRPCRLPVLELCYPRTCRRQCFLSWARHRERGKGRNSHAGAICIQGGRASFSVSVGPSVSRPKCPMQTTDARL